MALQEFRLLGLQGEPQQASRLGGPLARVRLRLADQIESRRIAIATTPNLATGRREGVKQAGSYGRSATATGRLWIVHMERLERRG